jgi:hypothetical protein
LCACGCACGMSLPALTPLYDNLVWRCVCVHCGLCAGRPTHRTPRDVDCIRCLVWFRGCFVGVKDNGIRIPPPVLNFRTWSPLRGAAECSRAPFLHACVRILPAELCCVQTDEDSKFFLPDGIADESDSPRPHFTRVSPSSPFRGTAGGMSSSHHEPYGFGVRPTTAAHVPAPQFVQRSRGACAAPFGVPSFFHSQPSAVPAAAPCAALSPSPFARHLHASSVRSRERSPQLARTPLYPSRSRKLLQQSHPLHEKHCRCSRVDVVSNAARCAPAALSRAHAPLDCIIPSCCGRCPSVDVAACMHHSPCRCRLC